MRKSTEIDFSLLMILYVIAVVITPEFTFLGIPKIRISDLLLVPLILYLVARLKPHGELPLMAPFVMLMAWDLFVLMVFGQAEITRGLLYLGKRLSYYLTFLVGLMVVQSSRGWQRIMEGLFLASPLLSLSVLWNVDRSTAIGEAQRASGIIANQEASTALFLMVLLAMGLAALPVWKSPLARLAIAVSVALAGPAMLATGTRGAVIDVLFALACLELLRRSLWRSLGVLVLVAILATLSWQYLPQGLTERLGQTIPFLVETWNHRDDPSELVGDNSAAARYASIRAFFQDYIEKAPVVGWGTGIRPLGFVDNLYVTEWVYHGFVGLLLLLWFLADLGRHLWRSYSQARDPMVRGVSAGALAALAGMLVAGLHSDSFYLIRPTEAFMLMAGLVIGRSELPSSAPAPTRERPRFRLPAGDAEGRP